MYDFKTYDFNTLAPKNLAVVPLSVPTTLPLGEYSQIVYWRHALSQVTFAQPIWVESFQISWVKWPVASV